MAEQLVERIEGARLSEAKGASCATISGTWLRKDAVSLNNRFYPAETVERVVAKAAKKLDGSTTEASASGSPAEIPIQMLDRHGTADTDESLKVVGKVTRVWMEGDLAKWEASIADTAAGRDIASLLDGGFINTVSLRAKDGSAVVEAGTVDDREMGIVRDFELGGIDFTLFPGIEDVARVESVTIFESVDPAKVRSSRLDETTSAEATWARSWYGTVRESAALLESRGLAIDVVQREWLDEKTKFKSPGHYTKSDREKIPAADFAGPNKTYPIVTQADVDDAAGLIGHASDPEAVKAKIKRIAKRKGFSLPKAWTDDGEKESRGQNPGAKTGTGEEKRVAEEGKASAPALSEAGTHSHSHTHASGDQWGYGSYSHEHAHGHSSTEMEYHDAAESHRHEHTVAGESAPRGGAAADGHAHTKVERVTIALVEAGRAFGAAERKDGPLEVARAAIALQDVSRALRECELSDEELETARVASAKLDQNVDKVLKSLRMPDIDGESARRGAATGEAAAAGLVERANRALDELREVGAAISSANRAKLAGAHDSIAKVLGMECCPKGDEGEMSDESVASVVRKVLQEERERATREAAAAEAANKPLATLIETVAKMAAGQAALADQVKALTEGQKGTTEAAAKAAAEAAAKAGWRPDRRTIHAENRDAGTAAGAGGGPASAIREQIADKKIPIEQRFKLAADALMGELPELQMLTALGAMNAAQV